jgi:DNA polymerase-1
MAKKTTKKSAKKAPSKKAETVPKKKAGKVVGRMGKDMPKDDAKPTRIVLLDSHAILHRAYHALPEFSKANGEPTGALYGLILMVLKINDLLKPDYIIATRDLPGKTVRHESFEAYKATRAQIDDALIKQLKQAPDIFKAFGIPVYEKPGYEADDMLGTIARETGKRSDLETIIATGDSDTLQLVGPRTRVFMIRTGISDTVIYDTEEVKAKYGFGPEYVVDYKGIVGDTSDNIPGVPGVGAGSASKLIATYGGLGKIYEALQKKGVDAVVKESGVRRQYVELVANNQSQALFSKDIATIHCDLPIGFKLPERHYHMKEYAEGIGKVLEEYEFHSIRNRLKGQLGLSESAVQQVGEHDVVVDAAQIKEVGVATWLLKSDLLNPTVQDILSFAKTTDFDEAKKPYSHSCAIQAG